MRSLRHSRLIMQLQKSPFFANYRDVLHTTIDLLIKRNYELSSRLYAALNQLYEMGRK